MIIFDQCSLLKPPQFAFWRLFSGSKCGLAN